MGMSSEAADSIPTQTIGLPTRPRESTEAPPRIPDYRFVKVIGRGAFGTVWLAEEPMAGLFRAIKVLHPHGAARIERELEGIHAYQAQAKDHPHLVRILKTGLCTLPDFEQSRDRGKQSRDREEVGHRPHPKGPPGERKPLADARGSDTRQRQAVYYVMEIADHAGGSQPHHPHDYEPLTLGMLLRRKGRLSAGSVVEHASVLLDAIDHMHKAGLHHRDVKPANCLFANGVLKLADMGLTASDDSTEAIGTLEYMPPVPTPRRPDDLYALGKVMYMMTTGQGAADFPDWPADLDPAGDAKRGIPPESGLATLRELINALCQPNADKRLTSIRELRHRLAAVVVPPSVTVTSPRRVALMAGLAVIVGIFTGAWTATQWNKPEDPMSAVFGVLPYSGHGLPEYHQRDGFKYSLWRSHRPGEPITLPCLGTSLTFWDIQSRIENSVLEVCGAFRIFQENNPVQRDITNPNGAIRQVCVCGGDKLRIIYHGQPGAEPGTFHDFGCRGVIGSPLSEGCALEDGQVMVYLAVSSWYSPVSAEEEYRDPFKRVELLKHARPIAIVTRYSAEE